MILYCTVKLLHGHPLGRVNICLCSWRKRTRIIKVWHMPIQNDPCTKLGHIVTISCVRLHQIFRSKGVTVYQNLKIEIGQLPPGRQPKDWPEDGDDKVAEKYHKYKKVEMCDHASFWNSIGSRMCIHDAKNCASAYRLCFLTSESVSHQNPPCHSNVKDKTCQMEYLLPDIDEATCNLKQ